MQSSYGKQVDNMVVKRVASECNQRRLLHVIRQVYYDLASQNSNNMVLFINGLLLDTVALKSQFTGQNWSHAVKQCKKDRVPSLRTPLLHFKKRALVHFEFALSNN